MHRTSQPQTRFLSERRIGIGAAIVTVLVWSAFIVIARASADASHGGTLTPFDIVFCRLVAAASVLLPWGALLSYRDREAGVGQSSLAGFSPLPLRVTASVGLFGGLLYALVAYNGFVYAPAAHASVLLPGSLPLWTALLAALFLHEHITPARALGLGLIVLGDLLVGGTSLLRAFGGGVVWRGDLLFMAGALCWAAYSVLARHFRLDAVRATIAITAFAAMIYLPIYATLAFNHWIDSKLLSAPWSELAFQAGFQGWGSVVISGITFTRMIQYFGPVRSTMITALVPGLSALAAALLLAEPLAWNLLLGLALVTGGILFGVHAHPVAAQGGKK